MLTTAKGAVAITRADVTIVKMATFATHHLSAKKVKHFYSFTVTL